MTQGSVKPPQRAYAPHTPKWQRFQSSLTTTCDKAAIEAQQPTHPYQRQYSHVYAHRLAQLKPRCWESAKSECGDKNATEISRILELKEDDLSIVVGTLVKERGDGSPVAEASQCHENDTLVLEDESGRVQLRVANVHEWCTGVVVAVLGTVDEGGVMAVERMYPPSPLPHPKIEGSIEASTGTDMAPHVLLVSGFDCGSPHVPSLPRDMLLAFLEGHLSPTAAAKVCRVVVAGAGCGSSKNDPAFGVKELDGWIAQVCAAGIFVDLLPSKDDPTTANWPQRPLHSCLLPNSTTMHSMLSRVPNPYACGMGDKFVVGSDGQNVADAQTMLLNDKQQVVTELQALKATLQWNHVCPTGPHSVPTVPHAESDPMVLENMPHIYFAGNCKAFDTDVVAAGNTKTRLVCVPKFADTKEVVLVNLTNLDCEIVRFDDQA